MHDPLTVAFEIRRPWPQRARYRDAKPVPEGKRPKPRWSLSLPFFTFAGFSWYFPSLITIWHREPGGKDSGTVCIHHHRAQDANGDWRFVFHRAWRFHVHHWKIQVSPLQHLRRWLLTRCEWCGGPSRKGDCVNVSHQWDGERGPWWRGERGLMSGGGFLVRCTDPRIEQYYPLAQWIENRVDEGNCWRRRVVVVEGWTELSQGGESL